MSYVDANVALTLPRVECEGRESASSAFHQCLVVSSSRSRREMFAEAATENGWDAVVCADAENALDEKQRIRFQMAIIDLEGHHGSTPPGFRELCERIREEQTLMVVCGHQSDVREEIWARQLGAWLYLPGVEDAADVSTLCREAVKVTDQLSQAERHQAELAPV